MAGWLLLLLLGAASEPAEFAPRDRRFADAGACRTHLEKLAGEARRQDYVAVEGPYTIAAGDIRIHKVRAEPAGHRITEHRCLESELASRSWRHAMGEAEAPTTLESMAREAQWLKQSGPEQQ